jgi:hypothetical protein
VFIEFFNIQISNDKVVLPPTSDSVQIGKMLMR